MTQLIYLAGSLAGVAALVGLCAWLFGISPRRLDTDGVVALIRAERPDFRIGRIVVAADGLAALVEGAGGKAPLIVVARGDGLVARTLDRPFLRRAVPAENTLNLRFSDFTFPSARIAFADPAEARDWAARLAA
jgi:formate-dependent phosphoribosylglycinamide formyltransferase (GAR transformylase)